MSARMQANVSVCVFLSIYGVGDLIEIQFDYLISSKGRPNLSIIVEPSHANWAIE